jgi:copper(I)-binding protein
MKYISVLFLFFVLTLSAQEKIAVEIKEAWIRPAAAGMNTALFFKVTNHTESVDTLFDASSDAADLVEVHETYVDGDKMGMRRTKAEIKQGETVEFKPRSLHVMFIKLLKDMKIGDTQEVTLHFKNAGDVKITAEVKDNMPAPMRKEMNKKKMN